MNVNARVLAIIVPLTIIIGIALGSATGWWQTESSKEPARFTDGEFAGEVNPADIRGSYSLNDVSSAFGIPVDTLARAFVLSEEPEPGETLIKEFDERFGILPGVHGGEWEIGTDAMRLFVARYRGLPYEPETDTGMLPVAVDLVADAGTVSDESLTDLRARAVQPPETIGVVPDAADVADADVSGESGIEPDGEETLVKGNTTFGELLAWGVAEEGISAILGGEMGARGESVRTWAVEQGREFSEIKEALQELVNLAVR